MAQSKVLEADGRVPVNMMVGHIDAYLEDGQSLTVAGMFADENNLFKPYPRAVVDFGYTKKTVWLRFSIQNTSENYEDWRLYFHENFKQVFEVYVQNENGSIQTLLKLDQSSPFSDRPIAFPEMVAPFKLEPGKKARFLVRFISEGSSNLATSVETAESFASLSAQKMAKNFLFFGMAALLVVGALVATVIFRYWIFPAYAGYTASTLLFIMHADGVAFQLIWPNWPAFNGWASIPIGAGIAVFGGLFAMLFLQTKKYHPYIHIALSVMVLLPICLTVWSFIGAEQLIKKTLVLTTSLSIFLCAGAGLVAARTRFKQVRFYVLAWASAGAASLVMVGRHYFNIEISQDFQYDAMRVVIVFDAVMMGFAIADQYNQMRVSRQLALKQSLQEANRSIDLNNRLEQLEQRYTLAEELAQSRDEHLSNTVHDLRQPLNALRVNVQRIISNRTTPDGEIKQVAASGDMPSAQTIDSTFKYLEELVSQHLQPKAVAEPGQSFTAQSAFTEQPASSHGTALETDPDAVDIPAILNSVHQMFLLDAAQKDLSFDLELAFPEDAPLPSVRPMDLIRVVSNLVSNAIKYTSSGGVALSASSTKDGLLISVCDTGFGLTVEEFEKAKERSERLEGASMAEGSGLGLSIAQEVAKRNAWELRLNTGALRAKTGTQVDLLLPI